MERTDRPDSTQGPLSLAGTRIGIVGMHYAPETTGNAPYTTALAQALEDAGAAVLVLTGVPHYPQWQTYPEYRKGFRWADRAGRTVVLRRRHWVPRTPDTFGRGLMEATFLAQAVTTFPGLPVDALIAVTPMLSSMVACAAWSRMTGTPWGALVQDLTGVGAQQSGVAGTSLSGAIAKAEYRLLRQATAIGVVAPEFGQTLIGSGVDEARILLTPNFTHVQASAASQVEARQILGWPTDRFLVVYTGNMGMKQGLEVALDAAHESRDFDLMLVGAGSQRAALESRARATPNVHFVDPLPSDLYPLALAAADTLLVCERRTAGHMSLPSKLTSYMAAGRPILASVPEHGITARVVAESRSGVIAAAGDSSELIKAVKCLAGDPALCDALGESGKANADRNYRARTASRNYVYLAVRLCDEARSVHRTQPKGDEVD